MAGAHSNAANVPHGEVEGHSLKEWPDQLDIDDAVHPLAATETPASADRCLAWRAPGCPCGPAIIDGLSRARRTGCAPRLSDAMTGTVSHKLLAIFITAASGWIAGRAHWLGTGTDRSDPARVLSNAAFFIFVPALLFRTTVRLDFATMPWRSVWAYFVPALALLMAV
jgi:hypothetical protein